MSMDRTWTRRGFLHAIGAGATGWSLAPGLLAMQAQVPQTSRPMKIGIIGSGQQGGSLGLNWARAGHEVVFSSRHPETLADLVASAGPKARAGVPQEAPGPCLRMQTPAWQ